MPRGVYKRKYLPLKGRTYDEIYGVERAAELRKLRAKFMSGRKLSASTKAIKSQQALEQWRCPELRAQHMLARQRMKQDGTYTRMARAGGLAMHNRMDSDPIFREEVLAKQSASMCLKYQDPDYKKKWAAARRSNSEAMKAYWADPKWAKGMEQKLYHAKKGYYFSKKNNCRIFYASEDGELAAYLKLEEDPRVLKYGRVQFSLHYVLDCEGHSYRPDIMVEYVGGTKKIIEVKMSWEFEHPVVSRVLAEKLLALREYCENNGLTYEVWTEKVLEPYFNRSL